MKKYTSAALLALQLTWKAAFAVMLLGFGAQTWALREQLMPGGIPLQTNFSFGSILRTSVQTPGLLCAGVLLLVLILRGGATKGSKSTYTVKRLGLSSNAMTLVFGLVFTGYYLVFWAAQVGLCIGWYSWYSQLTLVSSNGLMLSAWTSDWFHMFLPLGEWFGYVRNSVLCLSMGFNAAFGCHKLRRGQSFLWSAAIPVVILFGYPRGIATATDYFLVPMLVIITAGYYLAIREGERNEDAL